MAGSLQYLKSGFLRTVLFFCYHSRNSLVNQLPEANLILLRHLFGVLHHIEQNSVVNQMNAFNLALCIAPNMLWLPSPTGPEEESRSTKKVIFHRFGLIIVFPFTIFFMGTVFCRLKGGIVSVTLPAEWYLGFTLSPVQLLSSWWSNSATQIM